VSQRKERRVCYVGSVTGKPGWAGSGQKTTGIQDKIVIPKTVPKGRKTLSDQSDNVYLPSRKKRDATLRGKKKKPSGKSTLVSENASLSHSKNPKREGEAFKNLQKAIFEKSPACAQKKTKGKGGSRPPWVGGLTGGGKKNTQKNTTGEESPPW